MLLGFGRIYGIVALIVGIVGLFAYGVYNMVKKAIKISEDLEQSLQDDPEVIKPINVGVSSEGKLTVNFRDNGQNLENHDYIRKFIGDYLQRSYPGYVAKHKVKFLPMKQIDKGGKTS